jgi:hypothetical protein
VRIADQCCGRLSKRPCSATGVADSHIESSPTLDHLLYRFTAAESVTSTSSPIASPPRASRNGGILFHRFALRGEVRVGLEAEIQHGHAHA